MELKRQEASDYPSTYKSFSVDGVEYYISDLIEDRTEEALELLVNFVIPEENFCKAIQIHTKPNAVETMKKAYKNLIAKRMSLACFKKETDELVGLNILAMRFRGEPAKEVDDPDMKVLRTSSAYDEKMFDIFQRFSIDRYLHAYGLGVKPQYRGKGIAVELLKARIQLLKVLGVATTCTTFSTLSSQKAAVKAGYTEVRAISYAELQEIFPNFDFSKSTGTHSKNFVLHVDL